MYRGANKREFQFFKLNRVKMRVYLLERVTFSVHCFFNMNKDKNIHRYAIRGKKDRERKEEREREKEKRERDIERRDEKEI